MKWLFKELTNTGATGDPTKGTREKGKKMREVLVDTMVKARVAGENCTRAVLISAERG